MAKKNFTVKKTGYILKEESLQMALQTMDLDKEKIVKLINGFIFPSKKIIEKECGPDVTPKKVQMTITVTIKEI